ncbi:arginine/serine-rich coiled-coil protein 2 isoform X2 [Lucilia sericata]|uniref:arginine/serine-rich coiled-coil protein 2 isoform X2 n=1 Tax=Lucilia sericata TaxID=13632 RepID=UPI0018A7F131|nr:arginine/serine-rich coiled-coil protein 2 isoform X2 [Lucilia sericata]
MQLLNDKYKIDRRADKSRDHRDKRESKESRNTRDLRDEGRDNDHGHKYDYKKHDDHKRYREPKGRDYKRDGNDYYRDDKRYNRYDDRKSSYASTNCKDRFNNSKSRYDERKQYDDHRFNDERRTTNEERRGGGSSLGSNFDDRRRGDFSDRRNYNNDDDRKTDRRNNDDRRTQRSYNEDRSNAYRPRRSNSPSLSQRNSSNNKYSERKDDTRRERKRHSRSRSRSRSNSADNLNESNLAPNNNNSTQRTAANELATEVKRPEVGESQTSEKKPLPSARNFEALLSLPLSENAPKHPNVVTVPAVSAAAAGSNVATATVQLPSYYNPNVINPNKYVEQMQKRKLIWGAKKTEDSASKWGHAQFSQDQDGKVASKFMRLMGIKSTTGSGGGSDCTTSPNESEKKSPISTSPSNSTDVKSREAMFSSMEQQYEVARQVTHTMRGVGLGFGSSRPY